MSVEREMPSGAGCLAIALMMPIGWLLWAYARVILWAWFIVPFGLPPLTFLWALGLGVALSAFTYRGPSASDTSTKDLVSRTFTAAIGMPLFLLAFGWVIVWLGGAS